MGLLPLPTNGNQLTELGLKMHTGMVDIGSDIPITMLTAEEFEAGLSLFTAQDVAFNVARSARLATSLEFQRTMDDVYTWLLAARKVVAVLLGDEWSTAWAQAGFINNSTAVPPKIEQRLALTLSLKSFLVRNPAYEAPSVEVTAAKATSVRATALAAQQVLSSAVQTLKKADQAWTNAYDALLVLMRTLIKNLEPKLAKDDPRWLAFGLQIPAIKSTPGQPSGVQVQLDQDGVPLVQCDAVPRATRYRCRTRLVGVETEYRLTASSREPLLRLPRMQAGTTMEIIVQAVNAYLQGVASEPVQFTMLPAVGRAIEAKPVEDRNGASSRNGNGNGNGHRELVAR